MATTKVGLTPAQKRKATRERKQAEASARYAHCERMFESMTDEEREDMVDKLEAIKDEFTSRIEAAEDEILGDLHDEIVARKALDLIKWGRHN